MRAVVQRVFGARIEVAERPIAKIGKGLVVFAALGIGDAESDLDYIAQKVANLRVFEDAAGKMNLSPLDVNAEILAVSNFTLYGDARRGRRPDFTAAAGQAAARDLYDKFVKSLRGFKLKVESGEFSAMMKVVVENDGPVTILLDSKKGF